MIHPIPKYPHYYKQNVSVKKGCRNFPIFAIMRGGKKQKLLGFLNIILLRFFYKFEQKTT